MRRFFVRFNRSESFVHTQSSAGFTIISSGFEFSVHTTRTVEFFGSNKANVFPFVILNSPEVAKNQTLGVKQLTRECTHEV